MDAGVEGDEDEDEQMRRPRGERGGKSSRRRKQRLPEGAEEGDAAAAGTLETGHVVLDYTDIEMADAGGGAGGGEGGGAAGGQKEEGEAGAAAAPAVVSCRAGVRGQLGVGWGGCCMGRGGAGTAGRFGGVGGGVEGCSCSDVQSWPVGRQRAGTAA